MRKLLKQAESDCKIAQESLDQAQQEIERLNENIERFTIDASLPEDYYGKERELMEK